MKTLILILMVFSLSAFAAEAKLKKKKKRGARTSMSVGLFAGPSFSYGQVDLDSEGSTRNSFSVLATLEFRLSPLLFLESGLHYARRGVSQQVLSTIPVDVQLDYLEFPLWLSVKANVFSPRTTLFFSFGPAFALSTNRSAEILGALDLEISEYFKTYDITLSGGVGFEQRILKTLKLVGQFRYIYGLIDIDSTDEPTLIKDTVEYYTRGFVILLGARIPF